MGLRNPRIDLRIDFVKGTAEGCRRARRRAGRNRSESGPKEMVVGSAEEKGNAKAEAGQAVAARVGNTFDETVQS